MAAFAPGDLKPGGADPNAGLFPSIANAPPWLQQMLMTMLASPAQASDDPQTAQLRAALNAQAAGNPQPQNPALANAATIPTNAANAPPAPTPQPAPRIGPGYANSTGATGGVYADMLDAYNYARTVGNHPSWPTPGAGAGSTPNSAPPVPPTGGTLTRRPGAANMGYYDPGRFSYFSYKVPESTRNAPIYTALNLFGGGGQAPNAQAPNASSAAPAVAPGQLTPSQLAANPPLPPTMPGGVMNQRVANAVSGNPNWWQHLFG